jgi:hypothetical protein
MADNDKSMDGIEDDLIDYTPDDIVEDTNQQIQEDPYEDEPQHSETMSEEYQSPNAHGQVEIVSIDSDSEQGVGMSQASSDDEINGLFILLTLDFEGVSETSVEMIENDLQIDVDDAVEYEEIAEFDEIAFVGDDLEGEDIEAALNNEFDQLEDFDAEPEPESLDVLSPPPEHDLLKIMLASNEIAHLINPPLKTDLHLDRINESKLNEIFDHPAVPKEEQDSASELPQVIEDEPQIPISPSVRKSVDGILKPSLTHASQTSRIQPSFIHNLESESSALNISHSSPKRKEETIMAAVPKEEQDSASELPQVVEDEPQIPISPSVRKSVDGILTPSLTHASQTPRIQPSFIHNLESESSALNISHSSPKRKEETIMESTASDNIYPTIKPTSPVREKRNLEIPRASEPEFDEMKSIDQSKVLQSKAQDSVAQNISPTKKSTSPERYSQSEALDSAVQIISSTQKSTSPGRYEHPVEINLVAETVLSNKNTINKIESCSKELKDESKILTELSPEPLSVKLQIGQDIIISQPFFVSPIKKSVTPIRGDQPMEIKQDAVISKNAIHTISISLENDPKKSLHQSKGTAESISTPIRTIPMDIDYTPTPIQTPSHSYQKPEHSGVNKSPVAESHFSPIRPNVETMKSHTAHPEASKDHTKKPSLQQTPLPNKPGISDSPHMASFFSDSSSTPIRRDAETLNSYTAHPQTFRDDTKKALLQQTLLPIKPDISDSPHMARFIYALGERPEMEVSSIDAELVAKFKKIVASPEINSSEMKRVRNLIDQYLSAGGFQEHDGI